MPGSVQSIERAAAMLRLLARRPSLSLMEIAAALDLAKGTTHGILTTLRGVGFVEQDRAGGTYRLGAGIADLASGEIDPNELRARAMNLADSLASRNGQAVHLGVLKKGAVDVVHHVFRPDNTPQQLETGSSLPAHATALGKVLLAHEPPVAGAEAQLLDAYTTRTITDPAALQATLAEVRARGWAVEVDERAFGRAAIAAPLSAAGGIVVGAIDVHGQTDLICEPSGVPRAGLVTLVLDAARSISRELGDLR